MRRLLGTVALMLAALVGAGSQCRAGDPAVTALVVTPDGTGFLQGSQAGILLRRFDKDASERLTTRLEHVHAFAFSPDGKLLAVAGGTPGEAGAVELWSWPEKKRFAQLSDHEDLVYDVAWLPSGKMLATASADRTVRLWDAATWKCTATLTGHSGPVLALAAAPDSALLCSGSADQTIRVWDPATGKLLRSLNNHLGPVHSLSFRAQQSSEPLLLASAGGDSTIRLWQPALGRLVRIVRHPTPVHAVAWSHDGTALHSGARDGRVRRVAADSDTILHESAISRHWIVSLAVCPRTGRLVGGDSSGAVFLPAEKP